MRSPPWRLPESADAEIRKVLEDQPCFSSNEKERLGQAGKRPRYCRKKWFRHLREAVQDHNKLSQEAHETLEERRRELATTLKNMTIRLQGNFDGCARR